MATIKTSCPKCGKPSITRSSRKLSDNVVERYCVCSSNICQCVFKTHTKIINIIHEGIDHATLSKYDKKHLGSCQ